MNNEPVAWMVDGVLFNSLGAALNISFDIEQPCIPLYTHPAKTLTDRIAELENQLGFIASINRAGLGVVSGTPMSSEKIEKIWNAIEEQKDDNFHYGWKKCEQYYGFSHPAKTLTDEEIKSEAKYFCHSWHSQNPERLVLFARAILKKASEK